MGNGFVNYLNSMNNASSDNINALAESQVLNEYYESIMVKRKLGHFIVDKIKNGINGCYIISGYAGDGKTSILVQILKELGCLNNNEKLEIIDEKIFQGHVLKYVKDMSELSEDKKVKLLKECLDAKENKKSAILISNTGPLINTFVKLFAKNDSDKRDEIENVLLKQLDENKTEEIVIEGKKFNLINIARIDNLKFVKEIIGKIIDENLWCECKDCINEEKCPVYSNKKYIEENKERVIKFIENYYIYLKEYDKRLTVRQILAHISFAMTGNLTCESIEKSYNDEFKIFRYNFANLFFGYVGSGKSEAAQQIRAIRLLNDVGLDLKSLDQDYNLFVKNDFSYFKGDLQKIVENAWSQFTSNFYLGGIDESINSIKQQEIRKSIRRYLLMYGIEKEISKEKSLSDQLYGEIFTKYIRATKTILSKSEQNDILGIILDAISIKNIGIKEKNRNLYLVLKKDEECIQNIFLVLASAAKKNFSIKQRKKDVEIEDIEEGYDIYLEINKKTKVRLTLPMMMYFGDIINGKINTDINPALSYGLDKLNALLVKEFREESDEEKLDLAIVTSKSVESVTLNLSEENKIIFE